MKEYHTSIKINASVSEVWQVLTDFDSYSEWNPLVTKLDGNIVEGGIINTTIAPLKETFHPILLSYKTEKEITWQGKRIALFLLAGKHYYRLKRDSQSVTTLDHGEYFTGLLSYFISYKLLSKMKEAFVEHNIALKNRIENV
jgi:hypothetical protein